MPPLLALAIWFILLILLFQYDPAKDGNESWALWVPVTWMFIVASRLPSQWVGTQVSSAATAFEEGNSLDRVMWLGLILLAIGILTSRSFQWADFFSRNMALMVYVSFALLSIVWSDFAFVALKRWFRDVGSYLMVLVVLSDPHPLEAARTLLRRLCYLLVPLGIILVKYFPTIGRQYEQWTGLAMYVGPSTSKNGLGLLCLFSTLFLVWDFTTRWSDRKERQIKRILLVDAAFLLMTAWLLYRAHSATSTVCALLGCLVIATGNSKFGQRHAGVLAAAIPICFCLYLILGFGFGLNGTFAEMIGRDPTLTDRTKIWTILLDMHTNPLLGTGYESFWLGPRLDAFAAKMGEPLNEAHNGYLEVYLNLGLVGLSLLVVFLGTAYVTIRRKLLASTTGLGSLSFAMWTVLLFFNVTEAGFKHGILWLALLLGAIVLTEREVNEVANVSSQESEDFAEETPLLAGAGLSGFSASDETGFGGEVSFYSTGLRKLPNAPHSEPT